MQKLVIVLVDESGEIYKTERIESLRELHTCNEKITEVTDSTLWWELANASYINIATIKDLPNSVEMRVSRYEWACPKCANLNHEVVICEKVTCSHCEFSFEAKLPVEEI